MIEKANVTDAGEILALQRLAYISEAEIYGDYRISPLTQTLVEVEEEFSARVFLKMVVDGRIVGSARGREQDGTCHVGRLVVHPDYQKRGYGSRLLTGMEEFFPRCGRFELFTGHKSVANIRLYQKHGYIPFKTETVTDGLSFIYLEKIKGKS
ncbi:GNAT family N-acetyltransferase [Anaeroselena agilis]|uniref:GNAT family N-acetyltransferase n=1 Tax=Anaeroselena agilis TaxID=3063788 RepID=A0ABU3NYU9_9FIRM|nr:GNAT family N-acetyltransferase [Selenomonadales bacterium 4137-cl]